MDDLAKLIPGSVISIIGLAVIMGVLIMLGTIIQEWGKSLYRRSILGSREKRSRSDSNYDGIERRADNKNLEHALTEALNAIAQSNKTMNDFLESWKVSHQEMTDNIEEIKRKQDKNWKRLFDEELPAIGGHQ